MGGSGKEQGGKEGGRTTWPVKGDARGSSSELTGRLGVTRLVKVTATPVWLSNSVFTWLAQLVRILCEATYHPCFVNAPGGGGKREIGLIKHLLSSFKRLYRRELDEEGAG